eukprot:5043802-Prymnesium_polylepis.3
MRSCRGGASVAAQRLGALSRVDKESTQDENYLSVSRGAPLPGSHVFGSSSTRSQARSDHLDAGTDER